MPLFCVMQICYFFVHGFVPAPSNAGSCQDQLADWDMFSDAETRVPDFLTYDEIEITDILICNDAVHFFLYALQDGTRRYTCLVCRTPSLELAMESFPRGVSITPEDLKQISARVQTDSEQYMLFLAELQDLLGPDYVEQIKIRTTDLPLETPPRLTTGPPLVLRTGHTHIELRGFIDVFFRRQEQ